MAWLGTWAKRIEITLDKDQVDAALSNFPVLLYLSAASGVGDVDVSSVFDELTSDGNRKKIAVTTSDGETQCYVEIERWDDANEKAWLHVKVPAVSNSADTDIYLYYDASQADNTTYVGDATDTPAKSVWDGDFEAVWHLAQDPNGDAANCIKDSTSNSNHASPNGSMTTADLVDAKVGKGLDFDGSDDYLNCGSPHDFKGSADFTVECLFKTSHANEQICATDVGSGFSLSLVPAGSGYLLSKVDDGPDSAYVQSANEYDDGSWHYSASVWDASDNEIESFVDASSVGTDSNSNIDDLTDTFVVGATKVGPTKYYGQVAVDEVRISSVARPDAWIKATYHSLWDSLATFGHEEVNVFASCASLTISPNAAAISHEIDIAATCASLTISPNAAAISHEIDIAASCASLTASALNAIVGISPNVSAACASLTITPNAATITCNVNLTAACASLTIAPAAANVALNVNVSGTCATLSLTANAADVECDVVHVNATCASLSIVARASLISYDIDVAATAAAVTIAAHDAVIWDGAAWAAWITAHDHEITRLYTLTLTGDADGEDDLILPMASFQARRRSGEPTFLAAVIPGVSHYDAILARASGELVIDMAYVLNGATEYDEELLRVEYENVRYYKGGRNSSLVVEGHKTESFTPKGIDLTGVTYVAIDSDLYRMRCAAPEMFVNPGDTARYDGDEFVVAEIVMSVSPDLASMELSEEAA